MSESSPQPGPGLRSSPAPGCIILCTTIVVFGGLAILYTFVFFTQNRLLGEFADDAPVAREKYEPTPEQIKITNRRCDALLMAATANVMDRVIFDADDLNTLIATRELLSSYRGKALVRGISEDGIEVAETQEFKKGLFGRQYLNATFFYKPEAGSRTVLFNVADIKADDAKRPISDEFVQGYAGLQFFKLDSSNPDLAPVLKRLGRVYLEGDKVVVETRIEIPN